MHDLDRRSAAARSPRAGARGGRGRARASAASTPERRSGSEAQAVVVGRRAPELEQRAARTSVCGRRARARSARPLRGRRRRARRPSRARAPSVSTGPTPRRADGAPAREARRHGVLLPGDLVPGRRPRRRSPEEEAEGDEPLPDGTGGAARSSSTSSDVARGDAVAQAARPRVTTVPVDGELPRRRGGRRGRRSRGGCGSGTRPRAASTARPGRAGPGT